MALKPFEGSAVNFSMKSPLSHTSSPFLPSKMEIDLRKTRTKQTKATQRVTSGVLKQNMVRADFPNVSRAPPHSLRCMHVCMHVEICVCMCALGNHGFPQSTRTCDVVR